MRHELSVHFVLEDDEEGGDSVLLNSRNALIRSSTSRTPALTKLSTDTTTIIRLLNLLCACYAQPSIHPRPRCWHSWFENLISNNFILIKFQRPTEYRFVNSKSVIFVKHPKFKLFYS